MHAIRSARFQSDVGIQMTPEECQRMNELSLRIQEEKNYDNFAALLQEMSELIARKQQRRFQGRPNLVWTHNRPWKTLPGVVQKIFKPGFTPDAEKAEISVGQADHLFREVRIENSLMHPSGEAVALKLGARVDITFQADVSETVKKASSVA